jgi:hypothetical protein
MRKQKRLLFEYLELGQLNAFDKKGQNYLRQNLNYWK